MPQSARILSFENFKTEAAKKAENPPEKKLKAPATDKSERIRIHLRYTDPVTGKRCEKNIYGQTQAEAEKKRREFMRKIDEGLRLNEQGRTVTQWADTWLEVYKKPNVKETTYRMYADEVARINKAIGFKPLSAVLQQDIQKLLSTRKGFSASAIKKTQITVNAIFQAAVNNRLIPFNPCVGTVRPSGPTGTHKALTKEEVAVIVDVANGGHRFGSVMLLMLFAGLRRGEAIAIDHTCIDGDVINVKRAAYFVNNTTKMGTTKSAASIRTVPIFPPLKNALSKLKGYAAKPSGGKNELVTQMAFKRGYSSFITACEEKINGCQKRWMPKGQTWRTFDVRPHDLRHTFATMLYDAGVDVKTAQLWLGHADPAVTLKIYTHLTQTRQDDSIEKAVSHIADLTAGI